MPETDALQRVETKLQAFCAQLPADERQAFAAMVVAAARALDEGPDVSGFSRQSAEQQVANMQARMRNAPDANFWGSMSSFLAGADAGASGGLNPVQRRKPF